MCTPGKTSIWYPSYRFGDVYYNPGRKLRRVWEHDQFMLLDGDIYSLIAIFLERLVVHFGKFYSHPLPTLGTFDLEAQ